MSSDGSVIAATSAGGAPYFSVDSGASWTFLGTAAGYKAAALSRDGRVWYGLVGNTGTVHKVVLDNRFTLVAGTQGGDIIRSTDGGVSWAHVTKPSGSLSIQGEAQRRQRCFLQRTPRRARCCSAPTAVRRSATPRFRTRGTRKFSSHCQASRNARLSPPPPLPPLPAKQGCCRTVNGLGDVKTKPM